ncbi:hypothetical protein PR202_ga12084 [Eleusine coracana subsp. coracana]|uniref:Uncharacterized protein n=1 Tax=Eleusine coracana subsp. coracana TaxID=191504 RepID=A0AAV5CB66_ELECO|nr:hypothetical protein QOZ80_5AG0395120 [Eleusine coracana subsp. coracana]GJM95359.1 hypothetical protein PR202_ga12084 [Eleusine coracana subsp. coracana]
MDKQSHSKNGETGSNGYHRMVANQIAGGFVLDEVNALFNTPRNSVHSKFIGSSGRAAACTTGSRNTDSVSPNEYVRDPGSILSLQPWIFRKSGSLNKEETIIGKGKNLFDGFHNGHAAEVSPRSPGLGSGPRRGCGALRSRSSRKHLIKPLVQTENSYIPQLYSESFEIEECTFAPVPSPASVRPFIVTDGRRVISKSRYEPVPFNIGFDKEECLNGSRIPGSVIGIAPLPELKKLKKEGRELHNARRGLPDTQRSSKPSGQAGLRDRMHIFSYGVTIGILSCSLSNKKELEALKGTLKRMENLVQDLQDELEMKEGLTVKELPNETSVDHGDNNSKAYIADSEPMSKIEAELEAELARLELNITSKRLEEETSDFDEEFVGNIVQGELKVDMTRRDLTDYSTESDHGRDSRESCPDYTHGSNYPVSPRDLSIRLHRVIQHRLEDRIKELESVLSQKQKQTQLQMMATERIFSERICSNSESGSSSNQESPLFVQETGSLAEPYCLNLSGDALEAYDEAYEEFMRIADSPCTTSTNGKPQVTEDYLVDRGLIWGMDEDSARKLKEVPTWEHILKSVDNRAHENDADDEDETDDDDQDSKVLIQQIVERTKQGSPVLINAQKLLFSVDQ